MQFNAKTFVVRGHNFKVTCRAELPRAHVSHISAYLRPFARRLLSACPQAVTVAIIARLLSACAICFSYSILIVRMPCARALISYLGRIS